MIKYNVSFNCNKNIFNIILTFIVKNNQHKVIMPTWIPGSYMIREFSKNIVAITATQLDKLIEINQINKNTWKLTNLIIGELVIIHYQVYAHDLGIRSAYIDQYWGYFNNTSLCLYVDQYMNEPCELQICDIPDQWQIGCADINSQNKISVSSYYQLIDMPVLIGKLLKLSFKVLDIDYHVYINGYILENFDKERFIQDLQNIITHQTSIFNNIIPYSQYVFLLNLQGIIYTGLEHANSTLLMAPYYSLPLYNQEHCCSHYQKLLSLISHEFFHVWNIKSIKPSNFIEYDLNQENYTSLLWWFEGVTSYYDDLILLRAGLISKDTYLKLLLENINSVYMFNGVNKQSLSNSSLLAWIKYYRKDENSLNSTVNYYLKGALVALCIDLLIRQKTVGQKSLDDVILALYYKWTKDGLGINEETILTLIDEIAQSNIKNKIIDFIHTTKPLPLKQLLSYFGIELHTVNNSKYNVSGKIFTDKSELYSDINQLDLGCNLEKMNIGYKVKEVYDDTIAQINGITANDILISINTVELFDINTQLNLFKENDTVDILLIRNYRIIVIKVTLRLANFKCTHLKITSEDSLLKWLELK